MLKIPLNAPSFNEDEVEAAIAVLRSGQVTMSQKCLEFEDVFARTLKVPEAVFVNSGSSANLLAFFALVNPLCPKLPGRKKVTPGSEVIVPAVTWSTTIWPVVQAGLIPVLVDTDPETLQMDLTAVKKAITDKTVAICPVHVLGNAVEMKPLLALARENSLWVIEDTCEALGTKSHGQFVGTLGDMGTYSFFFSHHITTIEGGMIVTPHPEMAELFRSLRAHGWTRHLKNRQQVEAKYPDIDPRFLFVSTGFNLRPTEINAAFGLHQIRKLAHFNQTRVDIAERWHRGFQSLIEQKHFVPMRPTTGTDCTWFGYPILCRDRQTRDRFQAYLEQNGIETRPVICGNLARQPAFQHIPHRVSGPLHGADEVMDRGLFWGSHPMMSTEEVDYVIKVVKGFFQ